ncbi:MAG: sensor histidine kinase [Fidelibacterota bacterium]|nr:MAG: sensor histidine kinase [Candidatus Neomarinimicrobiota bacterium]
MKIEITRDLSLSPEQTSLLDMHSFLNVMNVLISQFYQIGNFLGDRKLLKGSIEHCKEIIAAFSDPAHTLEHLGDVESSKEMIRDDIKGALDTRPDLRAAEELREYTTNIESIFAVLDVRVREILARAQQPDLWIRYQISDLTNNFINLFTAIERNARGRYHIVYNIASKHSLDYFVSFQISSIEGETIYIPAVFQDVMRDLIMNARKYTDLGGDIIAGLDDDGEQLCFVVEDTGRGIPGDQIEQVVDYGVRARNVMDKETKGGGFGLTKAYFVTKQFGGRMWIESDEDEGTIITITIPSRASQPAN